MYLEKVKLTGVFEDAEKAAELECNENGTTCDIMDSKFPLEEALISQLIETVVNVLSNAIYKPEDSNNNSSDDLSNLTAFIRNNMKSNLQKQIES